MTGTEGNQVTNFSHEIVNFSNLPDELLMDIFSRFSFDDLCRCARVCRRWHALCKCIDMKRQIIIHQVLPQPKFLQLIEHHFSIYLEDFRILPSTRPSCANFMPITGKQLLEINSHCSLKILILKYCCLDVVTLVHFPLSLDHLSIRGCNMDSAKFFGLDPSLFLPHLVSLDIGYVKNYLTSDELFRLNSLKTLKALYMEGCLRINSGGIESIHKLLPRLEILDVEGTDISNEGAIFIMNNCPKMKKLFLGHTQIDDRVFDAADKKLMPDLDYFCVIDSKITAIGLQNFFKDFDSLSVLTVKAFPKVSSNFEFRIAAFDVYLYRWK
ncbi:hypothetical protein JTE90_017328 [Oedothorax gibbosus]|uniref:F-box domain-containing protein n=1 Tax=Oedothorax gibbosus TaxID=931172 RepID=A0AAV6UCM0_9ARAC|nr:hypothetical protein JTE90_017328 [Oedothorax gibbosus]